MPTPTVKSTRDERLAQPLPREVFRAGFIGGSGMDLCQPVEDFLHAPVKDEILRLRQTDRDRLEAAHRAPASFPTTTHSTEGNPTP